MKAARLVVLLSIILAQVLAIDTAIADHGECWVDGTGRYVCHYKGGGPGGGGGDPGEPGDPGQPPPLRYLQVAFEAGVGDCWQWSRTPPGFDSWDPANDAAIIITRLTLPECSSSPGRPPGEFSIDATAWEIFRSFPLSAPMPRLEPADSGITGLPTYLSVTPPDPVDHVELLPAGFVLEVEAMVASVAIEWGDGVDDRYEVAALLPYPYGDATHVYELKTCSAEYRAEHPSGPNCHPYLDAYSITITYEWQGRYRYDGGWVELGSLGRSVTVLYDVDEVVGVPQP